MSINQFPKQRLSYAEKSKDDFEWAKTVLRNLNLNYATDDGHSRPSYVNGADSSDPNSSSSLIGDYDRKLSNYQLYNNQLNQADFERECNPLGLEVGQFKDHIQPYNKTYNKIQVLLGEELKRPFNYRAVLSNSEGIKSKLREKDRLLKQYILSETKAIAEELRSRHQGEFQDEDQFEAYIKEQMDAVMPPHMIDKYMSTTYQESKEILANNILKYLFKQQSLKDKKNDAFKHALITGEEFVWVGVRNGEPVVDVLNTLGVFYHKSPEVKFVQDGLYAGYRTMMSVGDILDTMGEYLSEEDIDRLEGTSLGDDTNKVGKTMKYNDSSAYNAMSSSSSRNSNGSYGKSKYMDDWLVTHIEWQSQKKVGILEFTNEYGDLEKELVSEDFVVPEHAEKIISHEEYGKKVTKYVWDNFTLNWSWVSEVWSAIQIGDDMYCCIGPKPYQQRSMQTPTKTKLGYHGLIYNNMNADSVSLMDRMKPFQYLYFILVHKLKKLIAKDKGQVFHFDVSMVSEEMGLEKTIYYLEEMDIDFFDPLKNAEKDGAFQRGKVTGSTNRSNMSHILNYVQLMDAVDGQISDVAGVNRQREGQTSASEAVTNTQQNIIQSSTITEVYFQAHDKLWQEILQSTLECAQVAWADTTITKQYLLDDLSLQTLKMSENELANSDFGLFISNTMKENEVFQTIKQLSQPLLQNDKAKFSDIIKMIKSNSVEELERDILQSEKDLEKQQQAQSEAQQKQLEMQIKATKETQEDKQAHEIELQNIKDAAQYQRELIKAMAWNEDKDMNDNQIPDIMEIEKLKLAAKQSDDRLKFDKQKLAQDKQIKEEELKIKKKQANKPTTSK